MGANPRRDGERSFHRGYSRNPYKSGSFDAECWQRGYDEAKAADDAERKRQREETMAWNCDEWPDWLRAAVDKTNEVADRLGMSTEQAHAYGILSAVASAQDEIKSQRRRATDAEYLSVAYHNMLGEKGLEVANMWRAKGVKRVHFDWGEGAGKLTGEERAQVILDFEAAPRRLVEDIDAGISASPAPVAVPAGYRLADAPWTSRLAHIEQRTAIEHQSSELKTAIENLGGHPLLTDALNAADLALRILGKWHDDGEPGRSLSASPVPSTATQAGAVTEILANLEQWRAWAQGWSGSAFLSGEDLSAGMTEFEHKGELYGDLCRLSSHLLWLQDEVSALASSPETARDRAERRVAELDAAGLHTLGDIERAQSSGERAGETEALELIERLRNDDLRSTRAQAADRLVYLETELNISQMALANSEELIGDLRSALSQADDVGRPTLAEARDA